MTRLFTFFTKVSHLKSCHLFWIIFEISPKSSSPLSTLCSHWKYYDKKRRGYSIFDAPFKLCQVPLTHKMYSHVHVLSREKKILLSGLKWHSRKTPNQISIQIASFLTSLTSSCAWGSFHFWRPVPTWQKLLSSSSTSAVDAASYCMHAHVPGSLPLEKTKHEIAYVLPTKRSSIWVSRISSMTWFHWELTKNLKRTRSKVLFWKEQEQQVDKVKQLLGLPEHLWT